MYYSLAALAAVLIAAMVAVNGQLTGFYGIHISTFIIHAAGLLAISAAAIAGRKRLPDVRGLSPALFCGGAIGYLTTVFNVLAIGKISVTAILALSLLGQAITASVIDQFGFFDMPKRRFNAAKLCGLAFTSFGIVFLLWGSGSFPFVPVFVSLLTGATVVTSRQVNAQLAAKTSVTASTFFNYAVGLAAATLALLVFLLVGRGDLPAALPSRIPLWAYLGGPVGVLVVYISNVVTMKMPALIMTLIMFAGQVFGGVAIDAAFFRDFSWRSLVGGAFAFLGLVLNVWLDSRGNNKKAG